jgi:uncharacterized Ntn-hydrolase superfamily protein
MDVVTLQRSGEATVVNRNGSGAVRRGMARDLVRTAGLALLGIAATFATATAADMAGSFSIILRDPATGEIGIAAYSHAPSCGAWVPWVDANVGAIATQGDIDAAWGPRGLAMLSAGVKTDKIVDSLRAGDPGNLRRQVGILDRHGWPGGYSGPELINWSGGWLDSNFAAQGCVMAGHEALDAVTDTLYKSKGMPLVGRLFGGLERAQAANVDFRGARSAVLVVGRPNRRRPQDATRYIDLRVDDAADPVGELRVLYANWRAGRLVAARLDDAKFARARGDSAATRAALKDVRAYVRASLADSSVSAASLNAMAWALAQQRTMLDEAWTAAERAQRETPRSNEYADTEAEVRLAQGRAKEAHEIERQALGRVPLDDYLRARVETLRKAAGLPPDTTRTPVRHPGGRR